MTGFGEEGGKEGSTTTNNRDSSSSSDDDRGNLYVSGEYGTIQFGPETECSDCSKEAVAVVVEEYKGMVNTVPACENLLEELEEYSDVEDVEYWGDDD